MAISVLRLGAPPVAGQPVEIVERKGIGHPDTLCDALAEQLSIGLSRYYLDRFGLILHYNVDKALLVGGAAEPRFGGGRVLQPIGLYLAGRATREFQGVQLALEEVAVEGSREWLRRELHALDPERHVAIECLIRPGSTDLVELYQRQHREGLALANDTSCGVGYAPRDALEELVYRVERHLNGPEFKAAHPETGEDVKVMGLRQDDHIHLTVAIAMVDRYLRDGADYIVKRTEVAQAVQALGEQLIDMPLTVDVNAADDPVRGSLYLTVTGTSAEAGDDGEVGRGNRVNGLITPYRPMSIEAAAGKNPVTHVGKLYNIAAQRIAQAIVAELPEVGEAYCYLVSRIGSPIREPQAAQVLVRTREDVPLEAVRERAQEIVAAHLARLDGLWQELVMQAAPVY